MGWKAATIGQSGHRLYMTSALARYWEAARPPWRGGLLVVCGMTWQRAAIFFGVCQAVAVALPPFLVTGVVQFTIQPMVRATVMLQNPECTVASKSWFPNATMLNHLR